MTSKKIILAAALLCVGAGGAAAHEVPMAVRDVMERVASHNAEVRSAGARHSAVQAGEAVSRSARLPQINASLDLVYIGDGTVLDRDFSNAMRDRLPHFGNTLNVNLYQPVYQGGAITAGMEMARQRTELASIGVDQALEGTSMEALTAYFQLMKMRNLRAVYVENIAMTRRLIEQMREHYSQGTALRNDITRYELRLSSLTYDLTAIDNSISVLNHNLQSLLSLEPDAEVTPAQEEAPEAYQLGDEAQWQQLASTGSNELKAVDKSMDMTRTGLKLERSALLPKVGIIAGDNFTGPITFEIPALDKNYNYWFAGVSVSYEFSALYTAPRKMRQKRLELLSTASQREALEQALDRKVHEAFTAATQARQMLETERVNVRLANENYEVVETRFQNDMALLTDMLDASTAKLDAETRYENARADVALSYYRLRYVAGCLTTNP